ncbi:hypothetical protein HDC93_002765 [Streptomyces sp. AK010]|nr:hypothetical protein [Streptomyces sp. AK010]
MRLTVMLDRVRVTICPVNCTARAGVKVMTAKPPETVGADGVQPVLAPVLMSAPSVVRCSAPAPTGTRTVILLHQAGVVMPPPTLMLTEPDSVSSAELTRSGFGSVDGSYGSRLVAFTMTTLMQQPFC